MAMTRREFAVMAGAALLSPPVRAQTDAALLTRAIPSSGERLPAVGLGTAQVFNTADDATRAESRRGGAGAHRQWRTADRYGFHLSRCRSRAG